MNLTVKKETWSSFLPACHAPNMSLPIIALVLLAKFGTLALGGEPLTPIANEKAFLTAIAESDDIVAHYYRKSDVPAVFPIRTITTAQDDIVAVLLSLRTARNERATRLANWSAVWDGISQLKDLVWLDVSGTPSTDAHINVISGSKSIRHLNLCHTAATHEGVQRIVRSLPSLNSLSLSLPGFSAPNSPGKRITVFNTDIEKVNRVRIGHVGAVNGDFVLRTPTPSWLRKSMLTSSRYDPAAIGMSVLQRLTVRGNDWVEATAQLADAASDPAVRVVEVSGPKLDVGSLLKLAVHGPIVYLGLGSVADSPKDIAELAGLDGLQVLHLTASSLTDECAKALARNPSLRTVVVDVHTLADLANAESICEKHGIPVIWRPLMPLECAAMVKATFAVPTLDWQLALTSTPTTNNVGRLAGLTQIEGLSFRNSTNSTMPERCDLLPLMPRLTWIDIGSTEFSDESVSMLSRCKGLEELTVDAASPSAQKVLAAIKGLRRLFVRGDDRENYSLSDCLRNQPHLTELTLINTRLDESTLQSVRQFACLKIFRCRNSVADKGFLGHLRTLPQLGALELTRMRVESKYKDESLTVPPFITSINISGLAITPGFVNLIGSHPFLREVTVHSRDFSQGASEYDMRRLSHLSVKVE